MENTTDSKKTINRGAALEALNKISVAVRGPRGEKRRQHEAAKQERQQARKVVLLDLLTTGKPTSKQGRWSARYALEKATSTVKNGATAEELRACTQLMLVAPWAELAEPVEEYAKAKAADPAPLLEALCKVAPAEAPQRSAAAPETEEAPKAQPTTKTPARGRQGRARKEA